MPLVSSPIPNLTGGISQQPASMRLYTMCEWMENAWPSIVNGLQKRPATQLVYDYQRSVVAANTHIIERDDGYRYLVTVEPGAISVIDLTTGAPQTVNYDAGTQPYVNVSNPLDTIRFLTIGDYTFIANRNVTVATTPVAESGAITGGPVPGQLRIDPTAQATFFVKEAAYNTYYSVYINGNLVAQYLTPTGVSGSAPCPDTSTIAQNLAASLNACTPPWTTLTDGSSVTITNFPAGGTLQTQGGSGDRMCVGFVYDVQSFSDLMPTMFEGRLFRISGDMTTDQDDYFVVYKGGIWQETLDWNAGEALDLTTMPHALVRNADGTWTLKTHNWEGRQVGNTKSSKSPSFVGTRINNIFAFTNRLGFLADENVLLSEAGVYENFYRTTTAQLLDSDPLDIAVLHSNVDILHNAVPYNRDLLLMAQKDQFRLTYAGHVGQKTTAIQYTSSFNASTHVPAVGLGTSIYFVDDRPDYQFAKLYEMFPKDNATTDDADETTAPIPELIPEGVNWMAASNRSKTIVVHSVAQPTTLYVYRFFWSESKKVQNAWGVWTLPDCTDILWGGFAGNFLYLLLQRNGTTFLEKVRTDEDVWGTDEDYEVALDRRITVPPSYITYDSVTDHSTITMPYTTSLTPDLVYKDIPNGITGLRPQPVTVIDSSHIKVPGDVTCNASGQTLTFGVPYTMTYSFSTFFMRARVPWVGGWQLIQDGRLQIRYLTLEFHDTSYFTVTVNKDGYGPATNDFSGQILGSPNLLGRQPVATGKFRIPIMGENYKTKITLTNDTPFPSAFGSCEWQGIYTPKSAQRVI